MESEGYDTTGSRAPVVGEKASGVRDQFDTELSSSPPLQEAPPRNLSKSRWVICVASILSSLFLFALDNTIVALIQPIIVQEFQEIDKLAWLSVSFALGTVAVNLLWGKLYGQFNGKRLFIAAIILFEVGSAVCGAAPTTNAFIVGRVICGAGGAGIYMGALNLLSVSTTITERPLYLAFTGFTWGSGTVLGPIIGGAFADSAATWRWGFYINLCIGALAAPGFIFCLPSPDPRPGVPRMVRIRQLDWVGVVLMAGATTSGTMAISFGGALFPWRSGQVIGCFVCSGVLWALFSFQQAYCIFTTAELRLFPVEFVRSWELDILYAQTASSISCAFIPIYFIPIFFQFVRNESALQSGVQLLPFVFLMVFATICNGAIMPKTGYYMPWYLVGSALVIVGGSLLYTVEIDTTAQRIYGYSILLGVGAGLFSQASFSVAQAKVRPDQIAECTAFIGFGQTSGITLALSMAISIFMNRATNRIQDIVPGTSTRAVQAAIEGTGSAFFEALSPATQELVQQAVVSSINDAYVLCIAGGALSLVLSLFMKREKLFLEAVAVGG